MVEKLTGVDDALLSSNDNIRILLDFSSLPSSEKIVALSRITYSGTYFHLTFYSCAHPCLFPFQRPTTHVA